MKTAFMLLIAALSLGFMIDTPESTKQREKDAKRHVKEVRAWRKAVSKNYDLDALRTFLDEQIREHPVVEGISLAKAKTERAWVFEGQRLKCGDWSFSSEKSTGSSFTIWWTYEELKSADGSSVVFKTITLNCSRESKKSYTFLSAKREESEYIILQI
jgi:hypothetical protein